MPTTDRREKQFHEQKSSKEAVWQLRAILELSSDAIISIALDGTILSWNSAAEQMFGYCAKHAVGKCVTMLFSPGRCPDLLVEIQQGEQIERLVTIAWTEDHSPLDVSLAIAPIWNASKELVGASVGIRDITDLRRTRDGLQRLAEVFWDSADPIIIEDVFGYVIDLNSEAELTFGYTREELINKPVKTIIPPNHHGYADELLQRCLRLERIRNVESFGKNRTGKTFPVLLTLSPIADEHGRPVGIVTISKNITNLKRVQAQLRQANDELTRINEELDNFVDMAAHELHAPLITISGFGEILNCRHDDLPASETEQYINFILRGANRMKQLLNVILEYSRMGESEETFEAVDLDELAKAALADFQYEALRSQATVEISGLPVVRGSKAGLLLVLQNLIGNAVKSRKNGHPRVRVCAARDADAWCISVKDNGTHIDPRDCASIFAPLRQLHKPDEHTGSRWGLALCKKIIDRHNGRIWVESEPGEGATFRFTLPRLCQHGPGGHTSVEDLSG